MTISEAGDQGAGTGSTALPSPLEAVDDLRSAAKWTSWRLPR